MTGFIASVFTYRNRVSFREAFEGLEPDEGKLSRPVLTGPGSREAAWLLGPRQLVVWGLTPHKIHSLVGCSSVIGILRQPSGRNLLRRNPASISTVIRGASAIR